MDFSSLFLLFHHKGLQGHGKPLKLWKAREGAHLCRSFSWEYLWPDTFLLISLTLYEETQSLSGVLRLRTLTHRGFRTHRTTEMFGLDVFSQRRSTATAPWTGGHAKPCTKAPGDGRPSFPGRTSFCLRATATHPVPLQISSPVFWCRKRMEGPSLCSGEAAPLA